MKRLQSTLPNMVIALVCVTLFSGLLLGALYEITKEPIAQQAAQQQLQAIRDVSPEFNNNPEKDRKEVIVQGLPFTVYPAKLDGRLVGAAVKGVTMNGFSGEIILMVGFDINGEVRNYQVLRHAETPGLGSKMQEWFRDPTGARSIIGKDPATSGFYPIKDGGNIDGITAATYSSRAFLEAVRNSHSAFMQFCGKKEIPSTKSKATRDTETDSNTGASTQKKHTNHERREK